MSDARWLDVEVDVQSASLHLRQGSEIYRETDFANSDRGGYIASMAFMHALQSGYTSLEAALLRILDLLGEERPSGKNWHQSLLLRAGRAIEGRYARPAILPPGLMTDVEQLRSFRHRAVHAYDDFDDAKAEPATQAAARLADTFPVAVAEFRRLIDPDEQA